MKTKMKTKNPYLKDKVVVITGASRGLGKELSLAFSQKGSRCILFARSENALNNLINEITKNGGAAAYLSGNITNPEDIRKLREKAVADYGSLDIWVNNAGVWDYGAVETINPMDMEETFRVNTFGAIYGCREAYSWMKRVNRGIIVNVISTSGQEGKKGEAVYCASKFAVRGFTESLRKEAKEHGVRVIPVYQGGMNTTFFKEEKPDMDTKSFMDPRDVADAIVNAAATPDTMLPELYLGRN